MGRWFQKHMKAYIITFPQLYTVLKIRSNKGSIQTKLDRKDKHTVTTIYFAQHFPKFYH